jgi:GxxExxY protein
MLLYEKETYKIRGACFKVYNELGGGIKEKIIQRALYSALTSSNLAIEKEKRIDIYYNNEKVGVYIPDIIVENKIIVELKSKPFVTKEDEKQFWGYLKNSNYQLGFLINFSSKKLFIKRFIHTNQKMQSA